MMEIAKLIESEIGDFFAGFGHPGEPETPEEMQSQLLARVMPLLAGLEQEPVYQACREAGVWVDIDPGDAPSLRANGEQVRVLYAAPQLPQPAVVGEFDIFTQSGGVKVAVKDGVTKNHLYGMGWNACRASMLQGADGEPTDDERIMAIEGIIPVADLSEATVQGWIPCSEWMPQKNERVIIFINFNSETVPPSIHDAQFTGSTFRRGNATVNVFPLEDGYGVTHWMPLPAAPHQEEPNRIQEERVKIQEEMAMGARLTKHRFKP